MILVTGANGHLGRAIVDALLKKGVHASNIIGLVREETKAQDLKEKGIQLRIGDYDWYPTLVQAFKGIDQLILVSGRDLTTRVEQHDNVITAAKETGVRHLYYTSFFDEKKIKSSPFDFVSSTLKATDATIKDSGIAFTIFKNNLYAELLPIMFGQHAIQSGIYLPAGEGKVAYVTRPDIAEAIANVVTQPHHQNKEYNISNVENVSLQEVAAMLSSEAGTEVTYTSPSSADFIHTVEQKGLPAQLVKIFTGISKAISTGEFESASTDLERLLGRKPVSIKQFLKETYFKTTNVN